jgi:hypothetical protein
MKKRATHTHVYHIERNRIDKEREMKRERESVCVCVLALLKNFLGGGRELIGRRIQHLVPLNEGLYHSQRESLA